MSFGSQDGRSHPRVRRFGGDLLGSKWGVKINESAEDTVILLSQISGIGFRVLSEILGKYRPVKKPWVTTDILDLCAKRRKLENKKNNKDRDGMALCGTVNQEIKKGLKQA